MVGVDRYTKMCMLVIPFILNSHEKNQLSILTIYFCKGGSRISYGVGWTPVDFFLMGGVSGRVFSIGVIVIFWGEVGCGGVYKPEDQWSCKRSPDILA